VDSWSRSFSEDMFAAYCWFDAQKIEPLFPFGFGLFYRKFEYSALKVESAKKTAAST